MEINRNVSACVVLINPEGLILAVSRKDDHTSMGLPGGKMDPEDNGEPMTTAIRECKEETGLDVSNLQLVFAIHKDGNMGFTYLAEYSGEINHTEPHVVKWIPFEQLINGRFGKYNQMVSDSLDSMGIRYQKSIDVKSMSNEVADFIKEYFNGNIKLGYIQKTSYGYEVFFHEGPDDDFEESFDAPKSFDKGLEKIGSKYGVKLFLTIDYASK